MKLRNFLIVLFAILMVFAFASCKNEPKEEPKPTPKPQPVIPDYYQIEVTEGVDKDYWNRDKIKIEWEEEVNAGDVVSLKYRSERDVYQWDIRDGSLKWVYESKKGSFTDPVLGEDGWWTLTYTFANDINGAAVDSNERFGIYFRGNYVTTDLFEIKDITLNGEPLEITQDNIKSYAVLNDTEDHPLVEHDWSKKNWSVLFATGTVGEVDKTPLAEKVVDGGLVTGAPVNKEGYTLSIFTDADRTTPFDATQPITENKIFYYSYVGVPRALTFVLNGGAFEEGAEVPATVPNGDMLPEIPEPLLATKAFKAWYKDAELTTPWEATDTVLGDLTLYAAYGEPRTVTFDAQNGEAEHATKIVADGNTVKIPEAPENGSKMFLGWYTDTEGTTLYDFSTPVTADITIYAAWVNATDVTVNLNYEGAPAATTFKTALDVALAADDENLKFDDENIGFVFDGWYTDAACETAFDHTAAVTGPVTLYAKWVQAPLYKLVAVHSDSENVYSYDKLAIVHSTADVNDGDVLSFRFRTNRPFTFFSIRRAGGGKKWIYQNSNAEANYGFTSFETKADGWTYVTYKFDKATAVDSADIPAANADFEIHFGDRYGEPEGNLGIMKGDVLEVQDFAINGVAQTIADADVSGYAGATLSVVEGGSYEWAAHKVTFNTNEGSAIAEASVEFGQFVEKPEDPSRESKVFAGWYADAELTAKFSFQTQIYADTTIYAAWVDPVTLTFDSKDGSAVEAIATGVGLPIAKPADPTRESYKFIGWFEDEEFTVPFDFAAGIAASKTVYAKWIVPKTLAFNLNYSEAPAFASMEVEAGAAITAPKTPARVGYFFGGWYKEAECTNAFDFAEGIAADTTVYAKWNAPTKEYKFTTTTSPERFQWRFKGSSVAILNSIQPGDVITFQVKFTSDIAPKTYRLRTYEDEKTIQSETSFPAADGDGWYSITITAPADTGFAGKNGLYLAMFANGKWAIGDICEIKALAYNGQEIVITSSSSSGIYPGVEAGIEVIDL